MRDAPRNANLNLASSSSVVGAIWWSPSAMSFRLPIQIELRQRAAHGGNIPDPDLTRAERHCKKFSVWAPFHSGDGASNVRDEPFGKRKAAKHPLSLDIPQLERLVPGG